MGVSISASQVDSGFVGDIIDNNHPFGGVDYPRRLQEFDEWFPIEDACTAYFVNLRWSNVFICPDLRGIQGLDDGEEANALPWLSASDFVNRRNDLLRHPQTSSMVGRATLLM